MPSTLYHWFLYSTQDFVPWLIIPSSRFWPPMPSAIFMSTATGWLALLPSACRVMPCESSALDVGSVILLVSPCTSNPMSAVKEALFTCAIFASLSFTI